MNIAKILTGLAIAASLFHTSAHAQAKNGVGSAVSMTPSVIGGAPIQIAVYNFTTLTANGYYVDANGVLQSLPGASTVPPTGTTPIMVNSFRDATLFLQRPKGGGVWKHFGGNSSVPFISLGNPPAGWQRPGTNQGNASASPGGEVPASAVVVVKGKKTVNINKPTTPPAETPAPSSADADQSKRKAPRNARDPEVAEFLRIHNAARKDVGVAPLEWSKDLAATAQEWADRIARSGKLEPRPDSIYGENLGVGAGDYSPATAANAWLAEKATYDPDAVPPKRNGAKAAQREEAAKAAHYTQMVWGKSTMVGLGIATTKDGRTVVVANYNPRGNIEGEKPY